MKRIGKSTAQVSELIFGCWQMGGDYWGPADETRMKDMCRHAIDVGVTTFDTAYCYGRGAAETILGDALQGIDRSKYQLISKLWMTFLKHDQAIQACEDSLRRLKTDYLDVFFIHYPDPTGAVPIGETMDALNTLRQQGKIRAVGLSNFSLKQMKEAAQYGVIDVNQPCYNLLWRFIDAKVLPYCIANGIATLSYSSLAQGLLSGRYDLENRPVSDGRRMSALCQSPYYENAMPVIQKVVSLAEKYDTTPACVALNWNMVQPGITAPIVGFNRPSQLDDLLHAAALKLSDEDAAALDAVSRRYTDSLPHFKNLFDPTIVADPDAEE